MTPPAAKRRRSVEHQESVRNITVIKGGLSIMCPSVSPIQFSHRAGSLASSPVECLLFVRFVAAFVFRFAHRTRKVENYLKKKRQCVR